MNTSQEKEKTPLALKIFGALAITGAIGVIGSLVDTIRLKMQTQTAATELTGAEARVCADQLALKIIASDNTNSANIGPDSRCKIIPIGKQALTQVLNGNTQGLIKAAGFSNDETSYGSVGIGEQTISIHMRLKYNVKDCTDGGVVPFTTIKETDKTIVGIQEYTLPSKTLKNLMEIMSKPTQVKLDGTCNFPGLPR